MADHPAGANRGAQTVIVGLSGPSSSGKTTLARLLRTIFADDDRRLRAFIIHEDDFYHSDDRIPVTKTARGEFVQDWDTAGAINIDFLASALAYVRENGRLPPRLQSKEDQNKATDPGVDEGKIQDLSRVVHKRIANIRLDDLAAAGITKGRQGGEEGEEKGPLTIAFLEGFLLYAPPAPEDETHILRPVHDNINLHLFLPAPYNIVKARREARSGYVTIGPAPTPTAERPAPLGHSAVDLETKDDAPPQNFWTDPPGYVDDIVWPRYVQDHAWLLMPEKDDGSKQSLAAAAQTRSEGDLLKLAGQGVNMRADTDVLIAPGKGEKPMTEVLDWAVDEILRFLKV